MATRVLKADLSASSIDRLIQELEAYASSLDAKAQRLRELVADRIRWTAQDGFSTAIASDVFVGGSPTTPDVTVTVEEDGDVTVVIANGKDAVFVEFGAGVYHNGSEGTSPHMWGDRNNFYIGEYGKGLGKHDAWAIPGSTRNDPILTHGTPAAMPMYHGVQDALQVLTELAREVFNA